VIGRLGNVLEANMAAAKLRGEGINALVEPTNAFAATGLTITLNDQGVGILVPESQVEQAEAVLEAFREESSGAGGAAVEAEVEGEEGGEPATTEEKGTDQHLSWKGLVVVLLAGAILGAIMYLLLRR